VPGCAARRRISADPTSAALLLAGPSAVELWPGAELDSSGPDDQIRVTVDLPPALLPASGRVAVLVRSLSPRRTPTSFVVRFTFGAAGFPAVRGELALGYAPVVEGELPATDAELRLTVDDPGAATQAVPLDRFVAVVGELAEVFLANLAAAAEGRSRAA
jgi:hypothetical protein